MCGSTFAGSSRSTSRNCMTFLAMASPSGCRADGLDQRADVGRLGLHQPELAEVVAEVLEDGLAPRAAGHLDVVLDHLLQEMLMGFHVLGENPVDVDQLVVVAV